MISNLYKIFLKALGIRTFPTISTDFSTFVELGSVSLASGLSMEEAIEALHWDYESYIEFIEDKDPYPFIFDNPGPDVGPTLVRGIKGPCRIRSPT